MRRTAKWMLLTYCLLVAFVFLHFPRTISRGLRQGAPQVLLVPIVTPTLLRAYGQFIGTGTWPFGTQAGTIRFDQLYAVHSVENLPGMRFVRFVRADPEVRSGQEGRTTYDLGLEEYFYGTRGYVVGLDAGSVLRIGQYICLGKPGGNILFSPFGRSSRCITIHPAGNDYFIWRELGNERPIRVRLLRKGEN